MSRVHDTDGLVVPRSLVGFADPRDAAAEAPHRGRLILALGLLSLAFAPLGLFVWVMASRDLRKMTDGTMDPAGESTTQAGRVVGTIAVGLWVMKVTVFSIVYHVAF